MKVKIVNYKAHFCHWINSCEEFYDVKNHKETITWLLTKRCLMSVF